MAQFGGDFVCYYVITIIVLLVLRSLVIGVHGLPISKIVQSLLTIVSMIPILMVLSALVLHSMAFSGSMMITEPSCAKRKKRDGLCQISCIGCRLYVTLFPCNECAKAIIQCGIEEIIYADDKYCGTPSDRCSKRMLDAAGVKYQKYTPSGREIRIHV